MRSYLSFIASRGQQAEARRLDEAIWKNLEELGYDA
ncbi:MAG: hypothetical protein KatS3mg052_0935 [Candidatus Roseilinea sp.]|nr:MAG: hypothetical protein KatS3mg052_0935 [Candidatus Roseilinea sp.]